jgi:hypothetical protein
VKLYNLKIKIYRTIILPLVLYGCETWSLTLREEHRLRVLRRIFGPKRDEVTGEWRKFRNGGWVGHVACMGRREEAYTGFWWENRRERDHLVDPGIYGRIILWQILRKWDVGVWTGLSWLRIETGGRHS